MPEGRLFTDDVGSERTLLEWTFLEDLKRMRNLEWKKIKDFTKDLIRKGILYGLNASGLGSSTLTVSSGVLYALLTEPLTSEDYYERAEVDPISVTVSGLSDDTYYLKVTIEPDDTEYPASEDQTLPLDDQYHRYRTSYSVSQSIETHSAVTDDTVLICAFTIVSGMITEFLPSEREQIEFQPNKVIGVSSISNSGLKDMFVQHHTYQIPTDVNRIRDYIGNNANVEYVPKNLSAWGHLKDGISDYIEVDNTKNNKVLYTSDMIKTFQYESFCLSLHVQALDSDTPIMYIDIDSYDKNGTFISTKTISTYWLTQDGNRYNNIVRGGNIRSDEDNVAFIIIKLKARTDASGSSANYRFSIPYFTRMSQRGRFIRSQFIYSNIWTPKLYEIINMDNHFTTNVTYNTSHNYLHIPLTDHSNSRWPASNVSMRVFKWVRPTPGEHMYDQNHYIPMCYFGNTQGFIGFKLFDLSVGDYIDFETTNLLINIDIDYYETANRYLPEPTIT